MIKAKSSSLSKTKDSVMANSLTNILQAECDATLFFGIEYEESGSENENERKQKV